MWTFSFAIKSINELRSLPRWISYWAVGWQIYATRYSTEIDGIFAEMLLVRDQVAVRMPGNKRSINNYLQETWPIVVGLTSGLERFEGTDWLAGHFKEYVDAQETAIRSRLDRIQYDIDSSDTVHEIIRGEPIERVRPFLSLETLLISLEF